MTFRYVTDHFYLVSFVFVRSCTTVGNAMSTEYRASVGRQCVRASDNEYVIVLLFTIGLSNFNLLAWLLCHVIFF